MLRAYTAAALAGAWLTAGLGWAQQPPKPADGEKVMILNKEGRAPRRCVVLKTWKHPSGGTAYEVRALDNGEIMTVIEGPSADAPKAPAKTDKPVAPGDKPVAKAEKPGGKGDKAAAKADKPVTKTDKSTAKADKPGAKGDRAVAKADKPDAKGDKAAKADKSKAKPEQAAAKADKPGAKTDPLLAPTKYTGDPKVQKVVPGDAPKPAPPASEYTKQPVPAAKRWFAYWEPEPATAKPAKPAMSLALKMPSAKPTVVKGPVLPPMPMAVPMPVVIAARYHPDPVIRLIGALKDDDLPSLREVAAESLARSGRGRTEVTDALVTSAQTDPAPSVRACCCRCLAGMQVKSSDCVAALHALTADEDSTVRAEAVTALMTLEMK
jgi:HEAT repeats